MNARVLHLEDDAIDAELFIRRLESEWPECEVRQVSKESDFREALTLGPPDAVVLDHAIKGWDGRLALEATRVLCPEVPAIIFSGMLGEEAAVDALREGAADYVLKDRPARLVESIRRAVARSRLEAAHRMARTRAEESHRLALLGELAAGLAHEFNNTLTVLGLQAALLNPLVQSHPRGKNSLDAIQKTCERAARFAQKLLQLGRGVSPVSEEVDLKTICLKLRPTWRALLPPGIRLSLKVPPKSALAWIDEGFFEQVMLNLILNARDALGDSGKITITVQPPKDGCADIWIQDDGPGIPAALHTTLFEPFQTTKKPGTGSGLGLALSRRLATSMNAILVWDESHTVGTRFVLSLRCTP